MRASGADVHPDDLPPALEWERPVWTLTELMSTQWRTGFGGRTGLDYGPAMALMREWGWPLELGVRLLRAVETEVLRGDAEK